MFLEFVQASEQGIGLLHHPVVELETYSVQAFQNSLVVGVTEPAHEVGVCGVDRHSDSDGLAVREFESADLFQLVRRPVSEVQRPGVLAFEGVTVLRDVVEMEPATSPDNGYRNIKIP